MTHAMPTCSDLNTTQGQRDAARLRSSSGGPPRAFVTAILGGRMTLRVGNDMFIVSVWHRLGHHVPATVPPSRANTVQELLPKQIMRWSARR